MPDKKRSFNDQHRLSHSRSVVLGVAGAYLAFDLAMPSMSHLLNMTPSGKHSWIASASLYALCGAYASQLSIASTWLVFGAGLFIKRFVISITVILTAWIALVGGARFPWLMSESVSFGGSIWLGAIIVSWATLSSLVLVAIRFVLQALRVKTSFLNPWELEESQFSIAQMLSVVTIAAFLLALGRFALPSAEDHLFTLRAEDVSILFIVVPTMFACNLLQLPLCFWSVVMKRWTAVFVWLGGTFAISTILALCILVPRLRAASFVTVVVACAISLGHGCILFMALKAIQAARFELERSGRQPAMEAGASNC